MYARVGQSFFFGLIVSNIPFVVRLILLFLQNIAYVLSSLIFDISLKKSC